jgi:hypothetical protein
MAVYTFISSAHESCFQNRYTLSHNKASLRSHTIEISYFILGDHKWMKMEINCKRNFRNHTNIQRVNNFFIEVIRREIKKFLEWNKSGNTTYHKEIYSYEYLH